ncbi:hypothetical protein D3C87_447720 [compost metagenome]
MSELNLTGYPLIISEIKKLIELYESLPVDSIEKEVVLEDLNRLITVVNVEGSRAAINQ